jgi:hypothetical protein
LVGIRRFQLGRADSPSVNTEELRVVHVYSGLLTVRKHVNVANCFFFFLFFMWLGLKLCRKLTPSRSGQDLLA